MLNVEKDFFTLYKSVDAICRDMFAGKRYYNDKGEEVFGLSAYIRIMETESSACRPYIPEWDGEYKKLKRLRRIRTQIAHEVGVSDCGKSDLGDLDAFYRQLMNQSDILARAHRLKTSKAKSAKTSKKASAKKSARQTKTTHKKPSNKKTKKKKSVWPWLFGIAAVIAIAVLIIKYLQG